MNITDKIERMVRLRKSILAAMPQLERGLVEPLEISIAAEAVVAQYAVALSLYELTMAVEDIRDDRRGR